VLKIPEEAAPPIPVIKPKKEEYNINEITDPVYVLLPKSSEYVLLTKEIHESILNNEYDF